MIPGEYKTASGSITCNEGRATVRLSVVNTGDRPVQVGSHFHFFEVNRQLQLDRTKALGMRLDIPAGTAVRFEPGEAKEVALVAFGGNKLIRGFNILVDGPVEDPDIRNRALETCSQRNFKNQPT